MQCRRRLCRLGVAAYRSVGLDTFTQSAERQKAVDQEADAPPPKHGWFELEPGQDDPFDDPESLERMARPVDEDRVREPLPVSLAAARLRPVQWAKLDAVEKLTCIVDCQRAVDGLFDDHVTLPRTPKEIEDDIDDALPKYPSPTLRTIAAVSAGGGALVQKHVAKEKLRLGVSPALATWLGAAMATWLRVLHDVQDITARRKNPHAETYRTTQFHRARVLPTKNLERLMDPLVGGDLFLGDRGSQFRNDEGQHVENVIMRAKDFGVAPIQNIDDRAQFAIQSDHRARLMLMSCFAALASQLFIYGNAVRLHTDDPTVAAFARHTFSHLVRVHSCLELRTYGAAARLDQAAARERETSANEHERLIQRDGVAMMPESDGVPIEMGTSYVSPALLQNTWVLLGTDAAASLWNVSVLVKRVAAYVAENQPAIVMLDPNWRGGEKFMGLVETAVANKETFSRIQWHRVTNLEAEWAKTVMTPCVTVFASPEQESRKAFRDALAARMEVDGKEERAARANAAVTAIVNRHARVNRTRRAKSLAQESARAVQLDEFIRPMRIVGVNVNAHDVLFTHPQLEFSSGRVGNALRFASVQRSVLKRPFGSGALFSGIGGGLQPNSEQASGSRSVLRQERSVGVLQRALITTVAQYLSARWFGV
jgi:hypothetical protein